MKEEKEGLLPGGIRSPYPFDAAETLDCGQAFRWVELPGEAGASLWEGVAFGKVLRVEQRGQQVWLGCSPEDYEHTWRAYFMSTEQTPVIFAAPKYPAMLSKLAKGRTESYGDSARGPTWQSHEQRFPAALQ